MFSKRILMLLLAVGVMGSWFAACAKAAGSDYTNKTVITVVNEGLAHYNKGELDAAIALWEKAIVMDPAVPQVKDWIKQAKAEKSSVKPEIGKPAPEIEAKQWINSKDPVSLAKWKGSVVIVEFWATWCPPCRQSIPHLNSLFKKYSGQGLKVVGLSDEDVSTVREFMKKMAMDYVVGTGSGTGRTYGVRGIPAAFLIDRKGVLVWQGHPLSGDFEQNIVKLLEETK